MSKQAMISQVTEKLSRMGVPFQIGQGADLTIYNEFVDAGWSTGKKRIVYEASVFVDEASSIVFMWEKTTETGSGFSGGLEGGTFSQSGKTLFRKVKSIQYGPDGKAYEYELDLGAIPKTVKEAAQQAGWKFKTVLSKGKAQYPSGYQAAPAASYQQPYQQAPIQPMASTIAGNGSSFCSRCGQPISASAQFCAGCGQPTSGTAAPTQTPPVKPQEPTNTCKKKDAFKILGRIAYIATFILVFAVYLILKVNSTGWLIGVPVFALSTAIQFTVVKKGCATGFVIWFVTTAILLIVSLFTMAA